MKNKIKLSILSVLLVFVMMLSACSGLDEAGNAPSDTGSNISSDTVSDNASNTASDSSPSQNGGISLNNIPEFDGETAYVAINQNKPFFTEDQLVTESYENYSELDSLSRCGVVMACIGIDIMPTEDRTAIGQVKPSGWHTVKYDIVDGKYLYNRCHLIGFQLTGENANERNLITGTRYLNIEGMLPFENMIADYVKETENHVIYRVTPIFEGTNLLANGVLMEAYSVEDNGEGICFNVYAYNAQPGINIDYATGVSALKEETDSSSASSSSENASSDGNSSNASSKDESAVNKPSGNSSQGNTSSDSNKYKYVLNVNSEKFHYSSCASAKRISNENKAYSNESRSSLIASGYSPCKNCKP